MENYFHNHKEVEELQKLQIQRQQKAADKYQNITSRVNSSLRESKNDDLSSKLCALNVNKTSQCKTQDQSNPKNRSSAPTLQNKNQKGVATQSSNLKGHRFRRAAREPVVNRKSIGRETKVPSDPNLNSECPNSQTRYKSQGIQTLDVKHMSNLYAEGTIRYPTRRSPRLDNGGCKTSELAQQTDATPRDGANSPSDRGDVSPALSSPSRKSPEVQFCSSPDEGTDFVKLNKQKTSVAAKIAAQLNNGVAPTNYRKGVVPKYDFKSNTLNSRR